MKGLLLMMSVIMALTVLMLSLELRADIKELDFKDCLTAHFDTNMSVQDAYFQCSEGY